MLKRYELHPGDCRDTISAVVGQNAIKGRRWALAAETVIDWIFERLGEAPGHCRREAEEAYF